MRKMLKNWVENGCEIQEELRVFSTFRMENIRKTLIGAAGENFSLKNDEKVYYTLIFTTKCLSV